MWIEISIALAVLIFAILSFFVIQTLIALKSSLHKIDHMTQELEIKTKNVDSFLHALSNLGDICEHKTNQLKQAYLEKQIQFTETNSIVNELAEWLLLSASLGEKLLKKGAKDEQI